MVAAFAFAGGAVGWLSMWLIELVAHGDWGCRLPGELGQRSALAVLGALAMAFAAVISRSEMSGPAWARATAGRVVASCAIMAGVPGLVGGGMYLLKFLASGVAVGIACVPWALLIVGGHRSVGIARRGSLLEGADRAAFALAFLCGVMLIPWCASGDLLTAAVIVVSTSLAAAAVGLELCVRRRRLSWVAELFAAQPNVDEHAAERAPVRIDLGLGEGVQAIQQGGHPYRGGGHLQATCRGHIEDATRAARHLLSWASAVLALGAGQLALIYLHLWMRRHELWWC